MSIEQGMGKSGLAGVEAIGSCSTRVEAKFLSSSSQLVKRAGLNQINRKGSAGLSSM